jgi:hypothetical protein
MTPTAPRTRKVRRAEGLVLAGRGVCSCGTSNATPYTETLSRACYQTSWHLAAACACPMPGACSVRHRRGLPVTRSRDLHSYRQSWNPGALRSLSGCPMPYPMTDSLDQKLDAIARHPVHATFHLRGRDRAIAELNGRPPSGGTPTISSPRGSPLPIAVLAVIRCAGSARPAGARRGAGARRPARSRPGGQPGRSGAGPGGSPAGGRPGG